MGKIVSHAELQYRRDQRELDACRRIAGKILNKERSEVSKQIVTTALQGWLDAGNGRPKNDGPEAA